LQFFMLAHERALSVQSNNKRRALYQERLRNKAQELMKNSSKSWIDDANKQLYSRTYYFHRRRSDTDADNLSKPVLDALIGAVFRDDKQVIWRVAAKIDLNEHFSISRNLPAEWFRQLLLSIDDENIEDIVFIEVGDYSEIDLRFGREQ